jgi:hypothetical protein
MTPFSRRSHTHTHARTHPHTHTHTHSFSLSDPLTHSLARLLCTLLRLTDEQVLEMKIKDLWTPQCYPSGGSRVNRDDIGRRTGNAPLEKMAEVLTKTCADAQKAVSKVCSCLSTSHACLLCTSRRFLNTVTAASLPNRSLVHSCKHTHTHKHKHKQTQTHKYTNKHTN